MLELPLEKLDARVRETLYRYPFKLEKLLPSAKAVDEISYWMFREHASNAGMNARERTQFLRLIAWMRKRKHEDVRLLPQKLEEQDVKGIQEIGIKKTPVFKRKVASVVRAADEQALTESLRTKYYYYLLEHLKRNKRPEKVHLVKFAAENVSKLANAAHGILEKYGESFLKRAAAKV